MNNTSVKNSFYNKLSKQITNFIEFIKRKLYNW